MQQETAGSAAPPNITAFTSLLISGPAVEDIVRAERSPLTMLNI